MFKKYPVENTYIRFNRLCDRLSSYYHMSLPENAICRYCKKELFYGRTDRRFCNDTCRNAFNRERRKQEANVFGESTQEQIIQILKKNHTLLLKFNPVQHNGAIVDRSKLYNAGFYFNYFTGMEMDGQKPIYFCFEQSWSELDYGLVEVGVDYEKLVL